MRSTVFTVLVALLIAPSAAHAAIVNPIVHDDRIVATIDLGAVDAELSVSFEQVVGLNVANLGLSAELVSVTDLGLLSRLDSSAVSLPNGFPVLLRIQPPASGGLAFEGVVNIELYTHNLNYTADTPLRLFSAVDGGPFRDITATMASGSYRVRGSKGTFSEFLIVADTRPLTSVIDGKFSTLSDLLYAHATSIDGTTFGELESLFADAETAWNNGDAPAAIAAIEAFAAAVQGVSGAGISNVWRSARDLDNVAGELRAAAATLRFSLTLASNSL